MIALFRLAIAGWLCCWTISSLAQAPVTNAFQLRVNPPENSIFVELTTNTVVVTITNYLAFTNVTVVGTFGSQTNIQFLDDGRPPDQGATNGTFSANLIPPKVSTATIQPLRLIISADLLDVDPTQIVVPDPENPEAPSTVITNLVVTNIVNYIIVPRPLNDNFTNAFKITAASTVILATNNYATLEPGEPRHANVATAAASVWWSWSAPVSTNVHIDLGGSSFDPVLAVYTGSSLTNLTPVASATNDVTRNLKAHVSFNTKAGTTYRIAISGLDNSTNSVGNIRMRITPGAQPDVTGPIVSIVSPPAESLQSGGSVIFTGTAKERTDTESGVQRVTLQINTDTNIYVASGTENWTAALNLPPGTNLVRAIAYDYNGNKGPAASVVVRYLDPVNDLFGNAIALPDFSGIVEAVTTRATKEAGEPFHAANEGGKSIWYKWRAPFTGDLVLSTQSSSFDTLLAIYAGSGLSDLVEIANNDDAFEGSGYSQLTVKVIGNQDYFIAVDGFGAEGGNMVLSYTFVTTQTQFGLFIVSPLGGAVSPGSNLYPENTRILLTARPDKNFEFVQWEDPSGTFIATENPLSVMMNRNYFLEAKFRVRTHTDSFSTADFRRLPWSFGGQNGWSVQVFEGQFAAKAGLIGDRQSSSLILATNTFAGTVSFDVRVSSEEGWDWLEFYADGARLARWSGEVPWTNFKFPLTEGQHVLEWRYVKDGNFSQGLDTAFLDNVYLPLERPAEIRNDALLSIARLSSGQTQITLQGQENVLYTIEASANLLNWTPIATNSAPGISLRVVDPDAPRFPTRFYRAFTR